MSEFPEELKMVLSRYEYPRAEEVYESIVGKDLLFYDEHHGVARLLKNAEREDIHRLDDEGTSIVVLSGGCASGNSPEQTN